MAEKSNQPLFGEFPPVSTQAWMDKITADLKGADFEKKLVWKTNEGFNVRPFYRSEDLASLDYLNSLPGEFPYVRGTQAATNNWLVRQEIKVSSIAVANAKALEILTKGVDAIEFQFSEEGIITLENIEKLLSGINLSKVEINFSAKHGNRKLIEILVAVLKNSKVDISAVKGSLNFDPLGKLAVTGKVCTTIEENIEYVKTVLESASNMPDFKTIGVNGKYFNNAGCTIVQELAISLSLGNEYLAQLTAKDLSINEVASAIKFNFGISGNYFMEIAKFRAARLLWSSIVEGYKPIGKEVCKMHIHAETSNWNKTIFDANVNMLRTQTEAMSATLAGVDSLTINPFDSTYQCADALSERVARNQQLLLKEECHFGNIVDAAGGSYYLENLTDSIASEAWKLFVAIEEKGGFIESLKNGFIQGIVKESATNRKKAIASRRENILGTNQFPNNNEAMAKSISADSGCKACCSHEVSADAIVEPIVMFRGAQEFETLRLATEKSGKRPKVFMLTYGNLAMRLARSQFSGNFLGCAGYEIIDNIGFKTVEEGVEAAKAAKADIVVLCSSDDEYAEAAPAAFTALGGKAIFVVAGAPACTDELVAKGIKNFINVRSNVLETLKGFSKELGIN